MPENIFAIKKKITEILVYKTFHRSVLFNGSHKFTTKKKCSFRDN